MKKGISAKSLFITSFTLPDFAGSGINTFRFARYLTERDKKATILTFNRQLCMKYTELVEGVRIIRIPYFNQTIISKLLSLPIVSIFYLDQILKHNLIFVYGGKTFAFEIAILFARLLGKKIIFRSLLFGVDDIGSLVQKSPAIYRYAKKRLLGWKVLYYSINPLFTESYRAIFKKNQNVLQLPQGVDSKFFSKSISKPSVSENAGWPEDRGNLRILSVGFVLKRKGYEELFTYLAQLSTRFQYSIVGEYDFSGSHFLSNYQAEAHSIISTGQRILGDKIKFLGPDIHIRKYMLSADVLIHNATDELPNVVYEAMACSLPVIVREIPHNKNYILKHRNNCMIAKNVSEIIAYLEELHNNPNLAQNLAKNSRKTAVEHADFEIIYREISDKLGLHN